MHAFTQKNWATITPGECKTNGKYKTQLNYTSSHLFCEKQ